jgi:two-component system chemotaxis response regulator CheB
MTAPIRILVVDDSAVFRLVLARVLGRTAGMVVVGLAGNGREALEAAVRLKPDVVTLDVEMPELDGLATLRGLLAERPTRVVMLSNKTTAGAEVTLDALRAGAVDAIAKPDTPWGTGPHPFVDDLLAKIRAAAEVPLARLAVPHAPLDASVAPGPSEMRPAGRRSGAGQVASGLVVIATSTGGPRALEAVIGRLPGDLRAGVIVVQHMLSGFTATLATRLDQLGPLVVREAADGSRLGDGVVLIAPGDRHLLIDGAGRVALDDSARVNGLRPAADVTLLAAAPAWGRNLLAVVLTGMGRDGTAGAEATGRAGGFVIAQDEATATVYGMPRSVAEAGVANRILALDSVAAGITEWAAGLTEAAARASHRRGLRKSAAVADT